MGFEQGDVILTSDEEHPGLLAPLAAAAALHGVEIRQAPFAQIAEHGEGAALIACSHVSWLTGEVVDTERLAAAPAPVLLDGAQALGAIPLDVHALGCDFYASSGQKWLCGPEGTGSLWLREPESLRVAFTSYGTVLDPTLPLLGEMRPGAARFDAYALPGPSAAWALASLEVLEDAGLEALQERAAGSAAALAAALGDAGRTVAPRGPTTLVAWESGDNEAESARLLGEGLLVRHIPGSPYVRASVGGWTSEEELERLVTSSARG
jgi:L-cysteine/cystine lyase